MKYSGSSERNKMSNAYHVVDSWYVVVGRLLVDVFHSVGDDGGCRCKHFCAGIAPNAVTQVNRGADTSLWCVVVRATTVSELLASLCDSRSASDATSPTYRAFPVHTILVPELVHSQITILTVVLPITSPHVDV